MRNIFIALLAFCPLFIFGADYYWVNGTGSWSDTSHWATTSGGTKYHGSIPGKNDNVIFDHLSFSGSGQTVTVDLDTARCNHMSWVGVTHQPSFYSTTTKGLEVYGNLQWVGSMDNNFYGTITLMSSSNGVATIDLADKKLKNSLYISGDSCVLLNHIETEKNIYFTDGALNTNSYNISCNSFNPDSNYEKSTQLSVPVLYGSDTITIFSSLFLNTDFENRFNGIFIFKSSTIDTNYINLGGLELQNDCYFEGNGLTVLKHDFKTSKSIYFKLGRLNTNNYDIKCLQFNSVSSYAREITLGSSDIEITGAGEVWQLSTSFLDFYANQSILIFSNSSADTVVFDPSGLSYNDVVFNCAFAYISDDATYHNLSFIADADVSFEAGSEQAISGISTLGTCGQYVFIHSDERGSSFSFLKNSGQASFSYTRLMDVEGKGGASFAASNSLDEGNNTGIDIITPANNQTMYWIGGTGNWSDPANWSYSSGGSAGNCLPGPNNKVVFDNNSFASNDEVNIDRNAFCGGMEWESLTSQPELTGDNSFLKLNGGLKLHQNLKFKFSGDLHFETDSTDAILTDSVEIPGNLYFENGSFSLEDPLYCNGNVVLQKGTFDLDSHNLICKRFISSDSAVRNLKLTNALIVLNGDSNAWDLNSKDLTLSTQGATIVFENQNETTSIFNGGGFDYDSLILNNSNTSLTNINAFKLLAPLNVKTLTLESGTQIMVDSFAVNTSCAKPLVIKTEGLFGDSVLFTKTGYKVLQIDHVVLDNVAADVSNGATYHASNCITRNSTSGWDTTGIFTGTTYYWIGNGGLWSDTSHWSLSSGGTSALCLPTQNDTVIFDSNSFNQANEKVTLDLDANIASIFFDSMAYRPTFSIDKNIYVRGDVTFDSNMLVTSDDLNGKLYFTNTGLAFFNPNGIQNMEVNIVVSSENATDSLVLTTDLDMNEATSFMILKGIFNTNSNQISTGSFSILTDEPKTVHISDSKFNLNYGWNVFADTNLSLYTQNSEIEIYAEGAVADFYGNGHIYNKLSASAPEAADINIFGSNTFSCLEIQKGLNVVLEENQTQSIQDSLIAFGNCNDLISFSSSFEGYRSRLELASSAVAEMECLELTDIEIDGSQKPYTLNFSADNGNNSGFTFSSTQATTAKFTADYYNCYGDTISFKNLSTAHDGNLSNLSFTWYFDDGDTLQSASDTSHYFNLEGTHEVSLESVYSNGCSDLFTDTIYIKKPELILDVDEADFRICEHETVTFSAISQGDSFLFFVDSVAVTGFQTDTFFTTGMIEDGQVITALVMEGGCSAESSNSITFTVDSLPEVTLACSDPDQHICIGDTVTFTASGADLYQFYLNGNALGSLNSNNQLVLGNLAHGDSISVLGKYDETACESISLNSFVIQVHDLPKVSISTTDLDQTICAGDSVEFNFGGAVAYQFYIDQLAQNHFNTGTSIKTNSINYSCGVYVLGQSAYGCEAQSNSLSFTVNPVPSTTFKCSDADRDICAGDVVTFTATGASLYEFFVDDVSTGSPSALNYINLDSLINNQKVKVKGYINACSSVNDSVFSLKVRPNVRLICSDADQVICEGDEVVFSASGDHVYQFFVDNKAVSALSSVASIHLNNLTDGQVFSVQSTTGACLPNPLQFTVNPLPTNVDLLCDDTDQLICEGDRVIFTASGATNYEFFVDTVSVSSPSKTNVFSTTGIKNAQNVHVVGYTDKGCSKDGSTNYTFTANAYPKVSLTSSDPDQSICNGDSVEFIASGADSFRFVIENVVLRDYSTDSSFKTSQLSNGKEFYVLGKSRNCASKSDSIFKFRVYNNPVISLNSACDEEICEDDTIVVVASGANRYEFYIDDVSQGMNTLSSLNYLPQNKNHVIKLRGESNGCYSWADTILHYTVYDYPNVMFSSSDANNEICYGESILFSAKGAETYEFFVNGISQGSKSADSILAPQYVDNGDEFYLMAYNGSCGVKADSTYTIRVHKLNIALTNDKGSNLICENDPVVFKASGGDAYVFLIDEVEQGSLSSKDSFVASGLTNGQIVEVKAQSIQTGCIQTSDISYRIQVMTAPKITAATSTTFCKGDSVILESNYESGNVWYRNGALLSADGSKSIIATEEGDYTLLINSGSDGSVLSVGNNEAGQLGNNSIIHSMDAVEAQGLTDVVQLKAGMDFNIALDESGNIFSWGSNSKGQIGDATYSDKLKPVQLSVSNIKAVAAGAEHCLALQADSTILAWGNNFDGQLGYGNNAVSNFPIQVSDLENIVKMAAGEKHSLVLKSDGSVWAFGDNRFGQLGDGSNTDKNKAVQVSGLTNIVDIACGAYHSLALDADGKVWTWGNNANGQLGSGNYSASNVPVNITSLVKIVQLDGGTEHSLAINSNGQLYGWGSNEKGQLGDSNVVNSNVPLEIQIEANIQEIECGAYHNFALEADQSVWAWGYNQDGQLGFGHQNDVPQPALLTKIPAIQKIAAGYQHSSVIVGGSASCASGILSIQVDTYPDVVIYMEGSLLKTVEGVSYQWYYNGNEIPGATNRSYSPQGYGSYTVKVTFSNNCETVSGPFAFTSIEDVVFENVVSVVPNPNNGHFRLSFDLNEFYLKNISRVNIIDAKGSLVKSYHQNFVPDFEIDMENQGRGLYMIQIFFDQVMVSKKLIVY